MTSFRGGASYVLISRVASVALGFLSVPILARTLGPAGRGESVAAVSLLVLVPILLCLGIPIYVRRRVAERPEESEVLLRSSMRFALIASALAALGSFALAGLLLDELSSVSRLVFCTSLPLCVFFGISWVCVASVLIGLGRVKEYAVVVALPSLSLTSTIAALWALDSLTVPSAIASQALSYGLTAAAAVSMVRVPLFGRTLPLRRLVRDSSSYAGTQIAEAASYRLDQVLALAIIGSHEAGLYSVAATVGLLPMAVGQAISTAAFSQVVTANSRGETAQNGMILRVCLLTSVATASVLAVLSPAVIPLLMGSDFAGAIGPTLICLVGGVGVVVLQGGGIVLVALERGWRLTTAQVCGLGTGTIGLFILGPEFGAVGAATASTVGFLVCALLVVSWSGVPFTQILPRMTDAKSTIRIFGRIVD